MDMEFQGKRIHRSNAITMRIRTIQTIRLTERIAIIIQINAIRTTQLTAVVEHKTTSKRDSRRRNSVGGLSHINVCIFL
jgi:hypothetical protein